MKNLVAVLISIVALSCSPKASVPTSGLDSAPIPSESKRVAVIINSQSSDSVEIGKYYARKRHIPQLNLIVLDCPSEDDIKFRDYMSKIQTPTLIALKKIQSKVDFIVTTKGIPLRIADQGGASVDARIAAMESDVVPIKKLDRENFAAAANPYFGKNEPFDHRKFKIYLVTRLDGYSVSDAEALVDHSIEARGDSGPFFFDQAGNRDGDGYRELNTDLQTAGDRLSVKGFGAQTDSSPAFIAPPEPLMGYASWGSNDGAFNERTYRSLRFKPGAIAETFVSTSGRQFRPSLGGQSLIADLIAQGVTGVKGYVSEPYVFALARPSILFDRYVSGYNLAESFYMASPLCAWKDVIIGDPLCRPYAKNLKAHN